jgi:hypothetical protein
VKYIENDFSLNIENFKLSEELNKVEGIIILEIIFPYSKKLVDNSKHDNIEDRFVNSIPDCEIEIV